MRIVRSGFDECDGVGVSAAEVVQLRRCPGKEESVVGIGAKKG